MTHREIFPSSQWVALSPGLENDARACTDLLGSILKFSSKQGPKGYTGEVFQMLCSDLSVSSRQLGCGQVDKHAMIGELGIHYRDFRFVDPMVSCSSLTTGARRLCDVACIAGSASRLCYA